MGAREMLRGWVGGGAVLVAVAFFPSRAVAVPVPAPPAAAPVAALGLLGVLDAEDGRVAVHLVQAVVGGAHLGDRGLGGKVGRWGGRAGCVHLEGGDRHNLPATRVR